MAGTATTKQAMRPPESANQLHPVYMSGFAMEIYAVIILAVLTRSFWVLHGITLVVVSRIADILFAWFLHVKGAREIRLFKSWFVWWMRIGLDFASDTLEGDFIHGVLVVGTLNFWNVIGKRFTINWFDTIATKGRDKVLRQAKENLHQLNMSYTNFIAYTKEV